MGQYAGNASTSDWLDAVKKALTKDLDKELEEIDVRCTLLLPLMGEIKELEQGILEGNEPTYVREQVRRVLQQIEMMVQGE